MGKDEKSIDGTVEKLALIGDGLQTLFPNGNFMIALELSHYEFKKVQNNFRDVDRNYEKFKIDISGVEFMFLLKNESSIGEKENF